MCSCCVLLTSVDRLCRMSESAHQLGFVLLAPKGPTLLIVELYWLRNLGIQESKSFRSHYRKWTPSTSTVPNISLYLRSTRYEIPTFHFPQSTQALTYAIWIPRHLKGERGSYGNHVRDAAAPSLDAVQASWTMRDVIGKCVVLRKYTLLICGQVHQGREAMHISGGEAARETSEELQIVCYMARDEP